jgi:hypothetical protein
MRKPSIRCVSLPGGASTATAFDELALAFVRYKLDDLDIECTDAHDSSGTAGTDHGDELLPGRQGLLACRRCPRT